MTRDDARDFAIELICASAHTGETEEATWDRELADAISVEADGTSANWAACYLEAWGCTDDGEPWRISLFGRSL